MSMYVGLGKFREVSVREYRMPSFILERSQRCQCQGTVLEDSLGWGWKKVVFYFFVC